MGQTIRITKLAGGEEQIPVEQFLKSVIERGNRNFTDKVISIEGVQYDLASVMLGGEVGTGAKFVSGHDFSQDSGGGNGFPAEAKKGEMYVSVSKTVIFGTQIKVDDGDVVMALKDNPDPVLNTNGWVITQFNVVFGEIEEIFDADPTVVPTGQSLLKKISNIEALGVNIAQAAEINADENRVVNNSANEIRGVRMINPANWDIGGKEIKIINDDTAGSVNAIYVYPVPGKTLTVIGGAELPQDFPIPLAVGESVRLIGLGNGNFLVGRQNSNIVLTNSLQAVGNDSATAAELKFATITTINGDEDTGIRILKGGQSGLTYLIYNNSETNKKIYPVSGSQIVAHGIVYGIDTPFDILPGELIAISKITSISNNVYNISSISNFMGFNGRIAPKRYGVASSEDATGNNQAGAFQLRTEYTAINGSDPGVDDGVKLPKIPVPGLSYVGVRYVVINESGNDIKVYPGLGDRIGGLADNAPETVNSGSEKKFLYMGENDGGVAVWKIVS